MKKISSLSIFAFTLIFFLWIYSFFNIPTFDLDESLYRRVAEEMKWHGNYWHPLWGGWGLYHKPPIFYWLIAFFSFIFDGADAGVSILAARFPSFLASLGILFSLGLPRKKLSDTFLFWGCAIFPLITSTSVLYDPIQTLTLMPVLLISHRVFSEKRSFTLREYLWVAVSAFLASAFKGLNGLILPAFAIGVHTIYVNGKDIQKTLLDGLRFVGFSFLPAVVATALYYFYMDHKIGRPFTQEFFLIHHLGRGTQAMESHNGPFYYYIPVVLMSAGLLLPWFTLESIRTRFSWKTLGFGLTFSLTTLFFFSISATKLPHYTWPIWPAVILVLLSLRNETTQEPEAIDSWKVKLALVPTFILGAGLFWFAMNPELVPQTEIQSEETFFLAAAATLCFVAIFLFKKLLNQLELLAVIALLITVFMMIPVGAITTRIFTTPLIEVATALKTLNPNPGDCIRYSGPESASLSLVLGQVLGRDYKHNRCEPSDMNFLISPQNKKSECTDRHMTIFFENKTLAVCKKAL